MLLTNTGTVKVVTSDSKIWDQEKTTFELIAAASAGPVIVDLLFEGPDCVTAGIDRLLDYVRALLSVPHEHFLILTSNQLKSSSYPERRTMFAELDLAKRIAANKLVVHSDLQHKFGIFIGRSNWQRLGLAAYLHSRYADQTTMTFHYDPSVDYHISNFGLEEFVNRHWDSGQQVCDFLQHVPITHDTQTYPILWNQNGFGLEQQYKSIFAEIVCETYFTGRTFFVTEKTLRCIINRRPFIVQGPTNYVKNLKALGFRTFDAWWDEGYDQDPADARYKTLCNGIDWIASQSTATIQQWYQEMQPVLEHNVQCLAELTNQKILSTQFHYE